jgi:hypothetical protein
MSKALVKQRNIFLMKTSRWLPTNTLPFSWWGLLIEPKNLYTKQIHDSRTFVVLAYRSVKRATDRSVTKSFVCRSAFGNCHYWSDIGRRGTSWIFAVLEDSLPHISAIMGFKEGDELSNLLTCRWPHESCRRVTGKIILTTCLYTLIQDLQVYFFLIKDVLTITCVQVPVRHNTSLKH